VPTVTVRDVTERPETVECGSNMLAGVDPEMVLRCVRAVTALPPIWSTPPEYLAPDVSSAVAKIVLGYLWEGLAS
jgi:UDP-N-acetylglucosamine 2-epimerase (non-hydrolysing)